MPHMEWILELALVALLAATLFHAVRLERALGVLKRDRVQLQELIGGFNASTRQAEIGIERLRTAADGAGQQIARQVDAALSLKDDLALLIDRGNRLADRLDNQLRAGRPLVSETPRLAVVTNTANANTANVEAAEPRVRSQAERDLLKALRMAR
jgi:HAMP domain-containing protein